MAKYSRSSLSMRESLTEISAQRAEQFLNTFYFQYGHRSIADLAHIAFAVERLSLLAAIVLVDEQRWDGQERSTRYQNFLKSGWYFPDFGEDADSAKLYSKPSTISSPPTSAPPPPSSSSFASASPALRRSNPKPTSAPSRPAPSTSLATCFRSPPIPRSARSSAPAPSKPRSRACSPHPVAEVRDLGASCVKPPPARPGTSMLRLPLRFRSKKLSRLLTPALAAEAAATLHPRGPYRAHPRQVRQPNEYSFKPAPISPRPPPNLLGDLPIADAPLVDLVERTESLEVELAATLLYSASHHSYRQIRDLVAELSRRPRSPRSSTSAASPRQARRSSPRLSRRRRPPL